MSASQFLAQSAGVSFSVCQSAYLLICHLHCQLLSLLARDLLVYYLLCLSVCLSMCQHVYLLVYYLLCLSVIVSACLLVGLLFALSVCLSVCQCQHVYLLVYYLLCLSFSVSACLLIGLLFALSVFQCVSMSTCWSTICSVSFSVCQHVYLLVYYLV